MDDHRVGRALRALRRRRGLTQQELADLAGVSQSVVSRAERGQIAGLRFETLRALFLAVDAGLSAEPHWRGGALDRLLDEQHADLCAALVTELQRYGWRCELEATYSQYGERGSIDVLGGHDATRIAVVSEVKSEITSQEGTHRRMDEKVRLAPDIVAERFGWRPVAVGRLLVLPATTTSRRHVDRAAQLLDATLPVRGWEVRRWLRSPSGPTRALLMLPIGRPQTGRRSFGGAHRIRRAPLGSK